MNIIEELRGGIFRKHPETKKPVEIEVIKKRPDEIISRKHLINQVVEKGGKEIVPEAIVVKVVFRSVNDGKDENHVLYATKYSSVTPTGNVVFIEVNGLSIRTSETNESDPARQRAEARNKTTTHFNARQLKRESPKGVKIKDSVANMGDKDYENWLKQARVNNESPFMITPEPLGLLLKKFPYIQPL